MNGYTVHYDTESVVDDPHVASACGPIDRQS